MWIYQKKLQYPVKVNGPNPFLAQMLNTAYGGADGELSAALRYLNQRYTMPTNNTKGLLTDIGTEELAPLNYILYASPSQREPGGAIQKEACRVKKKKPRQELFQFDACRLEDAHLDHQGPQHVLG